MSFSPAVESLLHQWQTLLASVGPILKGEGQETRPGGTVERIGRRLGQRRSLRNELCEFRNLPGRPDGQLPRTQEPAAFMAAMSGAQF
jgi:hypothetical protein